MKSLALMPVSALKAAVAMEVVGAVASRVQLLVLLVTGDTLPAASVCRTRTAPLA